MARIYFSKFSTQKASSKKDKKNAAFLLEKFSATRPESKKQSKKIEQKVIFTEEEKAEIIARTHECKLKKAESKKPAFSFGKEVQKRRTERIKRRKEELRIEAQKNSPKKIIETRPVRIASSTSKHSSPLRQSRKWNDSIAIKWQKEKERLSKQKTKDPNSFDRFAMK